MLYITLLFDTNARIGILLEAILLNRHWEELRVMDSGDVVTSLSLACLYETLTTTQSLSLAHCRLISSVLDQCEDASTYLQYFLIS